MHPYIINRLNDMAIDEKWQRQAAADFVRRWQGRGYEKGESQPFWMELLHDVLGVEQPSGIITFEDRVHLDHTSFIDGYIEPTKVLIEQKGAGKDLRKLIRQSDGSLLTPFQQAKRYSAELPYSRRPRWVVTCNFERFLIYDMEQPGGEPHEILLGRLPGEAYRLRFLVDAADTHVALEEQVSLKASEIVGRLYAALLGRYRDPADPATLRSLNVLCVRLVFCLYAEDAGIFGRHGLFHDYLARFADDPPQLRRALLDLFDVLDTPPAARDPYMDERLAAFPYVNGGLFDRRVSVAVPHFDAEVVSLLLADASDNFDWSHISPTIFGALFESTLNPITRRHGGMHYTSIENIHKVIDPMLLNGLRRELAEIGQLKVERTRRLRIEAFRRHLAGLRFLDPACGSGNFLTETYLSLRRLENECLRLLRHDGQISLGGGFSPILVSIGQFYGIELNDFAVAVARTALWIAEVQMKQETETIVGQELDYLPLKSYPNITEANALRMDWNTVCQAQLMNYVMGNPPFTGARVMGAEQKDDLKAVFGGGWKGVGNLDYVCGWYKKAADYMAGTGIRAALVSSNSITQGEQVSLLWKPLAQAGVQIDFAYRTFRWDSEARDKARVHCVIVGFSVGGIGGEPKRLYGGDGEPPVEAVHINGYLLPMRDVFVESRTRPLCNVPEIGIGNKPIDDGNYLFTAEEKEAFLRLEPAAASYFRPWYGSQEFINNRPRYCLWLGDCSPAQLRSMPHCMRRVEAVRNFRLASKSPQTVKLADKPTRFHVENMPATNYIVIPETSSEKRQYIPIGFMPPDVLCSNLVRIIPGATLYHFGVLTSSVHMAWTRTVCGRLKSDYRYSKDVVYNNFPWPRVGDAQSARIEEAARAVLDARALYPDSTLADLYDPVAMPAELRAAHSRLDRLVLAAYGLPSTATDEQVVTHLFALYEQLTINN